MRADLARKEQHLARAREILLAPSRDGILGGRRRDNRTDALRSAEFHYQKAEELKAELLKSRALEWWIEDQWERVGTWV